MLSSLGLSTQLIRNLQPLPVKERKLKGIAHAQGHVAYESNGKTLVHVLITAVPTAQGPAGRKLPCSQVDTVGA